MRKFAFLLMVSLSFTSMSEPVLAGKGKPEINVRNFTYKKICDQRNVWLQHPQVLIAEGLGHLIPRPELISMHEEADEREEEMMVNEEPLDSGYSVQISLLEDSVELPRLSRAEASAALDKALKEDFLRKKSLEMKKTLGQNMIPSLWDAGCVTCAACTGLGGQFGVATAFGRLIATAKEAIRDLVIGGRDILSSENDPLEALELQYVVKKRWLNPTQQDAIENMFTAARASTNGLNKALEDLPQLLNLPTHSKLPNANVDEAIDRLAQGYKTEGDVDLAESLKNFCMAHLARYKDTKGVNPVAKHIIALQGPAGMGKSNIAKQIFKIMGLNSVEVSLAGGAESFFGSKKEPGAFLRAITNQDGIPQLNCGVILEEVDRLANAKADSVGPLLRLLDPQAGEIYLEGAGKFDWSQVAVIALMNTKVKSHEINDRWEVINIIGIEQGHREDVLLNGILPNFLHSNVPGLTLTVEDLPQESLKAILSQQTIEGFRPQETALRNLCSQVRRTRVNQVQLHAQEPRNGHTFNHSNIEEDEDF